MTEFDLTSYADVGTPLSSLNNRQIATAVASALPADDLPYTDGKTAMRAHLVNETGCSEADAECAIDYLERLGVLECREVTKDSSIPSPQWVVHPVPMR